VRLLAFVLAAVVLASGCGGDDDDSASTTSATTSAESKLDRRCIEATTLITNAIGAGLKVKGRKLGLAHAVKSTAFGSVFFVSGEIVGATSKPIGTWATNNLNLGGLIFSVDPVAKKLSRWPSGAGFDPKLTMKLDGARLSRTCVKQAGG